MSANIPCESRLVSGFKRPVNPRVKELKQALQNTSIAGTKLIEYVQDSSECLLSYTESDWYSLELTKKSGELATFYFRVVSDEDGDLVCSHEPYKLFERPTELQNASRCLKAGNKCKSPGGEVEKPKKEKQSTKKEIVTSPEVAAQLATIVTAGTSRTWGSKSKPVMTREQFDSMKSLNKIIDWMINNMDTEDLLRCVRKSDLSESQVKNVQSTSSELESNVVQASEEMSKPQLDRTLKQVTKEELVQRLMAIPESEEKTYGNRSKNLLSMCKRANIPGVDKYSVRQFTSGKFKGEWWVFMKDQSGKEVALSQTGYNKLIDECASMEAKWLRRRIAALTAAKELSASTNTPEDIKEILYTYGDQKIPASEYNNVKSAFPQIKNLTIEGPIVMGGIPSKKVDRVMKYFVKADITGNDLLKLDKRLGKMTA